VRSLPQKPLFHEHPLPLWLPWCLSSSSDGQPVIASSSFLSAYEGAYNRKGIVEVRCLGRVEETFLCGLVANGARHVVLMDSLCSTCAHHSGNAVAHVTSDTSMSLLSICGFHDADIVFAQQLPQNVELGSMQDESAQGVTRRRFVKQAKEHLHSTAQIAAGTLYESIPSQKSVANETDAARFVHVMSDGTSAHFIPTRRTPFRLALASRLSRGGDDSHKTVGLC
jgi:hypothetical protein